VSGAARRLACSCGQRSTPSTRYGRRRDRSGRRRSSGRRARRLGSATRAR
jgi:hypothetical protein